MRPYDASTPHPLVLDALTAATGGQDATGALEGYLAELRTAFALDEAGLLALGADGVARVRAWSGALSSETRSLEASCVADGGVDPVALAQLPLRRIALWPVGNHGVVLLGRRDDGPLPAPLDEPLLSAVLLAESAHAARRVVPVAAAMCAAPDQRSLWRGLEAALPRHFTSGQPCPVVVPGTPHTLVALAGTPAEREALAGLAGLAAVALARADSGALAA